jgi:hypothetical protein
MMDLLLIAFHCGDEERTGKEGCPCRAEDLMAIGARGAAAKENSGVIRLQPDARDAPSLMSMK